ncbi:importin-4-like isoform X1 [Ciona intestinalis]
MTPNLAPADPDLANHLHKVLGQLQVPDNEVIEQATEELRKLSQHNAFMSSLFSVLCSDSAIQVRQFAAVVFRRKIMRCWKSYSESDRSSMRSALLQRLGQESDATCLRSVMQIVGSVAKHELVDDGTWPELLQFIETSIKTSNTKQVECGMHLLSIVCETAGEFLDSEYNAILALISNTLMAAPQNPDCAYYSVQAFNALVPFLGDEQTRLVRPLVPKCVEVVKVLLEHDESHAAEVLEIFESLIETEVSFIAPYVKDLVLFSLQIANNNDLEDETRVRSLVLLQWIIKLKKKAILKLNLISPIIDVLGPILVSEIDDSDSDDEAGFIGDSAESHTPLASALHVIDDMALHLPPEKLFTKIMPFVQSCVAANEARHRRGLLLTLACLCEGTSEFIRANHLHSFVELVCRGAVDNNPKVRNAAMFALGQFSEYLQPDLNQFAGQVMPILFGVLQQLHQEPSSVSMTKAYYALENFAESLESGILPYLEQLMGHLLSSLKATTDLHTKELLVSAIGAAANAAEDKLLPYLDEILQLIQQCLSTLDKNHVGEEDEGELTVLHTQALDTLGVLVRTLGKLNAQLPSDCINLGMTLLSTETNDPDQRRAVFGLFAAVTSLVGEDMAPFMPVIVKNMLASVQSSKGIIPLFSDEDDATGGIHNFSFLDETDLTNGNHEADEEDEGVNGFSVENSYMDEKSDACESLGDLSKHAPKAFQPYLAEAFEEIFKHIEHPHCDVRKAAIATCGQFVETAFILQNELYPNLLGQTFPVICKTISKDDDRLVVMSAITTMKVMIEQCGVATFTNQEQDVQVLMQSLNEVLLQKSACQDEDGDEEDEQQAEYDEMLIEYCGDVFPVLAEKLQSSFLPYFMACLPTLIGKLKPICSSSERSFGAGTIAETIDKLGPGGSAEILQHVVPRFIQLSRDSEAEVRNNSIYGLGVLLQNGGPASTQHYPNVLGCLSQALVKEDSRRVLDNILGAVARLISANKELVPLPQVLPVLLNHLPLQEDHDEDPIVYGCLATLMRDNEVRDDVKAMTRIIEIFAAVSVDDDVDTKVKTALRAEVRDFRSRDEKKMSELVTCLDQETATVLQTMLAQ